jgi:lipoprotein-anchoring transpeptidase ErfK/SrfK
VSIHLAVLALLVANAAGSPSATSSRFQQVRPVQEVASLLTRHPALVAPRRGSRRLRIVAARRPITNERTVLPVVGHATDASGRLWLRVQLPGRPNGGSGWIERAGTHAGTTAFHLVVEISLRRVIVYQHAKAIRTFRAIVGKPSTPTPQGEYFVEEAVELPSNVAGAPFALALSARSDVYQEYAGGPGQVALHGLANVGGSLGTAVSHGCVRLEAAVMRWLVLRVGPGVPVTIRP